MPSTDKLTPLLIQLKERVRAHYESFSLSRLFTKSGIYAPTLGKHHHTPIVLVNLVKAIGEEVKRFETFEEFATAIESTAELAFMQTEPRGYYLFGGNFFIPVPSPPMLEITQPMIDSAIARRKARMAKALVIEDFGTAVQLEKFIDSEQQLSLWVQGYPIHRTNTFRWLVNDDDKAIDVLDGLKGSPKGSDGGECCPDFSCCSDKPGFPLAERKIFQQADEKVRWQMLAGSLQQAFIDMGEEASDVYIAGSMTPDKLHS